MTQCQFQTKQNQVSEEKRHLHASKQQTTCTLHDASALQGGGLSVCYYTYSEGNSVVICLHTVLQMFLIVRKSKQESHIVILSVYTAYKDRERKRKPTTNNCQIRWSVKMGGSSLNGSMNVNYGFGYFLSANSTMRSSIITLK